MSHWALWFVIAGFTIRTLTNFVANVNSDKEIRDIVISTIVYLMFTTVSVFAVIELLR